MRFNDDKVGQRLRYDKKDLLRRHKPNDPLAVPIKKQKKTFRAQGSVNWMREQFPLTLCYAITAHKVGILIYNFFYLKNFSVRDKHLRKLSLTSVQRNKTSRMGPFTLH